MSIALVTGAARGLGIEVARQLVDTGVEVVIGARDPQAAAAAVSELDGVRSYAGSLDIADPGIGAPGSDVVGWRHRTVGHLDQQRCGVCRLVGDGQYC